MCARLAMAATKPSTVVRLWQRAYDATTAQRSGSLSGVLASMASWRTDLGERGLVRGIQLSSVGSEVVVEVEVDCGSTRWRMKLLLDTTQTRDSRPDMCG